MWNNIKAYKEGNITDSNMVIITQEVTTSAKSSNSENKKTATTRGTHVKNDDVTQIHNEAPTNAGDMVSRIKAYTVADTLEVISDDHSFEVILNPEKSMPSTKMSKNVHDASTGTSSGIMTTIDNSFEVTTDYHSFEDTTDETGFPGEGTQDHSFHSIFGEHFSWDIPTKPCPPPPAHYNPFPDEATFISCFEPNRCLMRAALKSFYTERTSSNGKKMNTTQYEKAPKEVISTDFFTRFTYKDFVFKANPDALYGNDILPTPTLRIVDKEKWNGFLKMFDALMQRKNESSKTVKSFDPSAMKRCLEGNSRKTFQRAVHSSFKPAWDHQADGDQTNATLQPASIQTLSKAIVAIELEGEQQVFLDLGSSYGSLLWQLSDKLDWGGKPPILFGYEYSLLRHIWGCKCSAAMLAEDGRQDHAIVRHPNVYLRKVDLLQINSLGEGITIAFQFDKAFVIELCLHTLFCVLSTKSVQLFITCKGKTKNLKGEYDYQAIVQATECFQRVATIEGLKMNGGESAQTFYLYKKTAQRDINREFITSLLKKVKLSDTMIESVANTFLETHSTPSVEAVIVGSSSADSMLKLYQSESKKAMHALDIFLKAKRNRTKGACAQLCGLICSPEVACEDCDEKYPLEKVGAKKFKKVKVAQMGYGVVTKHDIEAETPLLEYKGSIKAGKGFGNYVAQLTQGLYVDGESSKCMARNVNHSCSPNSKLNLIHVDAPIGVSRMRTGLSTEDLRLWIVATKSIPKDTEITFHYGDRYKEFFPNGKCLCTQCLTQKQT